MVYPVDTTPRKLLLLASGLVLVILYVSSILRTYVASVYAERRGLQAIDRAIALQPLNAEYHFKRANDLLLVRQDFASAIRSYQDAVHLNPTEASYWLRLAETYALVGDGNAQRVALRSAYEQDPHTPEVTWQIANLLLAEGNKDEAFQYLRRTLENQPNYVQPALVSSWRVSGDAEELLNKVIPPQPDIYVDFINLLAKNDRTRDAEKVWSRLVTLRQPFRPERAFPYLDYLLAKGQVSEANESWLQMTSVIPSLTRYARSDNLLVNAGFDEPLLNGGFDWRYVPVAGANIELDTLELHNGQRSLAVTFKGTPQEIGIIQLVPVQPGRTYELSGYTRAEQLETAYGPRFIISDAKTGTKLLETDEILGTHAWQEQCGTFTASADTRLVRVSVGRDSGQTQIRGKLWVDDLKLTAR